MLSNHNVIESAGGYTIANSLRLRKSASASLSRTPGAAGNRKTTARRFRIKRGELGTLQVVASAGTASIDRFYFDSSDRLCLDVLGTTRLVTARVFRDPTAWEVDVGFELDVGNGTAALRAKIIYDGVEVSSYSTDSRASITATDTNWNNTVIHYIGRDNAGNYFDGYVAEPVAADGATSVTYSTTNSDGVLVPAAPATTYGTSGSFLKLDDGSNLTNLCLDRSGNGNNWTATNVSLGPGVNTDWMVDTPSVNYSTWNPLNNNASTGAPTDGNLKGFGDSGASYWRGPQSTLPVDASGNWWAEFTLSFGGSSGAVIGITPPKEITGLNADMPLATGAKSYRDTGVKVDTASTIVGTAYGASYTTGDVIGVHLNAGVLTFYKQTGGTGSFVSQGTAWSGLSGLYCFFGAMYGSSANYWAANFGQRPSSNSASIPSGAKFPCTANLPAATVTNGRKNFDALLHTGNGSSQILTGLQFQPDLAWFKSRNTATNHEIFDSVRGVNLALNSNATTAETTRTDTLMAFNSNGVTLGADASSGGVNFSTRTYVDWLWKAGGAAVTNTAGSITSQVSANTAAGFSIVTYTGNSTAGARWGHGLGVTPAMVIIKQRGGVSSWIVNRPDRGTGFLLLENTAAYNSATTYWTTGPSSTLGPTLTTNSEVNGAGTYVAYCFAEVPGFSKFGSYTGNGSADGPFVYCGFRPRWVMVKRSDVANDWTLIDTARSSYNVTTLQLAANDSRAELSNVLFDITASGFKVRDSLPYCNTTSGTYIFAAFAENPFGGSNVAPAPAR